MSSPPSLVLLLGLIDRFDGNDAELARLFGVSRTTVWRLKKGKIRKVSRYVDALSAVVGTSESTMADVAIEELASWARRSGEVRAILISLHRMLRISATADAR